MITSTLQRFIALIATLEPPKSELESSNEIGNVGHKFKDAVVAGLDCTNPPNDAIPSLAP